MKATRRWLRLIKDHKKKIEIRPRNWLVPVGLVVLREKSSHGYELMERLAEFGFEGINPGTLYRTLRRMEKEGLCESEWMVPDRGAACRVYSITESGEAHLDSWAEACERYQQVLNAFSLALLCAQKRDPITDCRA